MKEPKMKTFLLRLEEDLHRLLKVEAAKTGKDMYLIINDLLKKALR